MDEKRRLVELGKEMGLSREALQAWVSAEQKKMRDQRAKEREEARITAKADHERELARMEAERAVLEERRRAAEAQRPIMSFVGDGTEGGSEKAQHEELVEPGHERKMVTPSHDICDGTQSNATGDGGSKQIPTAKGYLEGKLVTILRDTGCNTVVVKRSLIPDSKLTGSILTIRLLDQSTKSLPEAEVCIDSPFFKGQVLAVCMENPLYEVVLGNVTGVLSILPISRSRHSDLGPHWSARIRLTIKTKVYSATCGLSRSAYRSEDGEMRAGGTGSGKKKEQNEGKEALRGERAAELGRRSHGGSRSGATLVKKSSGRCFCCGRVTKACLPGPDAEACSGIKDEAC
ncbi:hypothetical protein HPB49_010257 [Dermacentor silvarum]|uniref:Uncharacterized protein n=1 Tax=Dermacentor silvarum TaxID=543639 RepID=A0ACB8CEH3_DERSI|nr:hypothetical protein HPB49_010257 [Dermacentor silvarum]